MVETNNTHDTYEIKLCSELSFRFFIKFSRKITRHRL